MKLLIFILNKTEKLDRLLKELANAHLTGATVFNSSGMASQLSKTNDESLSSIFGSLRQLLKDNQKENKTIMMVVKEERIPDIEKIINDVVGNISEPNTGILFTVPIDFIRGYKQ
jgi:nitrogen regulatory protein PII